MTGAGAFPFDPQRLAELGELARQINGASAPPPISDPVLVNDDGQILLPVPDVSAPIITDHLGGAMFQERKCVWAQLHAGLTLQWAPMAPQDGLLVEFRGGPPDGDDARDAVAVFLTRDGVRRLIRDLQAIEATL